jgi:hypothetical protein
MGEKGFRFDLILALCALTISTVAALASVYQTRVIARQLSATVWPYVSLEHTYSKDGAELGITNYGLGPALIRSAWLRSDGKTYDSWDALTAAYVAHAKRLSGVRGQLSLRERSIDGSTVLSAGESKALITAHGTGNATALAVRAIENLEVRICYCSLLGQCWLVEASQTAGPQPQSSCPHGPAIALAPPKM